MKVYIFSRLEGSEGLFKNKEEEGDGLTSSKSLAFKGFSYF
jgi:hypothetical protein